MTINLAADTSLYLVLAAAYMNPIRIRLKPPLRTAVEIFPASNPKTTPEKAAGIRRME